MRGVARCSGVGDVILRSSVWPRYSVTERRSNSGVYTYHFYCCVSAGIAVKQLFNSTAFPLKRSVKRACKPDSVSRLMPGWWPSILSSRCRKDHAAYPGIRSGAVLLERRYPSIWPCSGWGFPASRFAPEPGALLPHRFTLACVLRNRTIGDLVSVALSVASQRLGVTQHPYPDGVRTFLSGPKTGAATRPS